MSKIVLDLNISELDKMPFYNTLANELNIEELRKGIIKNNYFYHLKNNKLYNDYVSAYPESPKTPDESFDVHKVPLIPSQVFKRDNISVYTGNKKNIKKICLSSGTRGSQSKIPRDNYTLCNFFNAFTYAVNDSFDISQQGKVEIIVLGPTTEEAKDLWFAYVVSCLSLKYMVSFYENKNVFSSEDAFKGTIKALKNNKKVFIVGPPFRILEVAEEFAKHNLDINTDQLYLLSAGGWKKKQNESIDALSYMAKVKQLFKMDSDERIRDAFNMVELNSLVLECKCHKKHIPVWLDVCARDPKTNEVLPDGKVGVLSYLDGSVTSFPCFILSEDLGIVSSEPCQCGMKDKTVTIIRRINTLENRGCALKISSGGVSKRKDENMRYSFYTRPDKFEQKQYGNDT